jgi:hypothetical protein
LERRLADDHRVAASDCNRVALATRIGTEAAQIGEEVIRARGAVDSDAEGHLVQLDLPVRGPEKHPARARFAKLLNSLTGSLSVLKPRGRAAEQEPTQLRLPLTVAQVKMPAKRPIRRDCDGVRDP